MAEIALELLLAPALIGASWLVTRRWGQQLGGVVSAFPAIAGPFLLLVAIEHGARFAAGAANGTLTGLVALAGFALAYARSASSAGWRASLALGWSVAAALAATVQWLSPGPPVGLLLAVASLLMARALLPGTGTAARARASSPDSQLLRSMALGALLVCLLALAADRLGPTVGGGLAGLPVIATVLALQTHRRCGAGALNSLLRGMLDGMVGFVLFCEIVAVLVVPGGIAVAFVAGAIVAAVAQASLLYAARRPRGADGRLLPAPRASA